MNTSNQSSSIFESRECLTMEEINKYLETTANEEERFSIENHLLECELCSAVIKGYSKSDPVQSKNDLAEINEYLHTEISLGEELTTDNNVEDVTTETAPIAKEIKLETTRGKFNWAIAAIGITLLGLALWTYSNKASQEDLFASYFEPYAKGLLATRSGSSEEATALIAGLEKYENSEFQAALRLLEEGLAVAPENGQATFYAGLAALEGNNLQKSIHYLKTTRINHSQYYGSATWYLSMAYLKQGENELAAETLKGLSEKDAPYFVKSLQLLQEIQN